MPATAVVQHRSRKAGLTSEAGVGVDAEVAIASCAASSPTSPPTATESRADLGHAGGVDHEPSAALHRCGRRGSDAGDPCRLQLAAEAAELVTLAVIEPGLGWGLHGPGHATATTATLDAAVLLQACQTRRMEVHASGEAVLQ